MLIVFGKTLSAILALLSQLVYWRYTTKKVLTLEYLPGIKIDDRQPGSLWL
jgi:hypothetical protein